MNQPLRIEELACEIARLEAKAADCRDLMAICEARELLVIIQRTDGGGKLMYTNAESRAAAVLTELVADKTWAETRAELRDVEVSIKVRLAQVEALRHEWALAMQMRREQLVTRQQMLVVA
jgi:hypothetical protein